MARRLTSKLAAGMLPFFIAACGLPHDPEGTLDRVSGGTLRAGLVHLSPRGEADERLLRRFATRLDATLQIRRGDSHELLKAIEAGKLDVIASLPRDTPFEKQIALSNPVHRMKSEDLERVWVARAGENGWMLEMNRFLSGATPEDP